MDTVRPLLVANRSARGVWSGQIHARARRCGGSASARMPVSTRPPLMKPRSARHPITTTTKSWPAASTIAWPSLLWVGRLHLGALLAFVPAFFSWTGASALRRPALADRRHRHLYDVPPPADPPELRHPAPVARIRVDRHRVLCLRGRADRLGGRSPEPPRPLRRASMTSTAPTAGFAWAHMFWWITPDVTSVHTPEYYQKWAPDLYKDPVYRWIDNYQFVFPDPLVRGALRVRWDEWLVWGRFVRTVSCFIRPGWSTRRPTSGVIAPTRPATPRRTSGGSPC